MIVNMIHGSIFQTSHKHIAFATNTHGDNRSGFAGIVSSRYWPELATLGRKKLGKVVSKKGKKKTFHALVCHSIRKNGWKDTPKIVMKCLDSIDIPTEETIAVVLIGGGMQGALGGADVFAILGGMARSKKKIVVYHR